MKIYNKIVIADFGAGEILEEDSFKYTGPVSECKGGGSSSTTSVDKEYNAGMLALSKEQQGWAREMFDVFKSGLGPGDTSELEYMQNVINANQKLLPAQTALERSQMGFEEKKIEAETELLPSQTKTALSQLELEQGKIGAGMELLPGQTELAKTQISDTMAGIKERAPVRTKFFKEAAEGVDVNERMNLAQADVAQGFAGAEGIVRRNAARMGRNPTNIDFGDMATNRAKAIGFARTKARTGAEDESWNRLRGAMAVV